MLILLIIYGLHQIVNVCPDCYIYTDKLFLYKVNPFKPTLPLFGTQLTKVSSRLALSLTRCFCYPSPIIIMDNIVNSEHNEYKSKYINKEDIELIVSKHNIGVHKSHIESYTIRNASDKMLGFLCDYWKIQVNLGPKKTVLQYFIKIMSVTNLAKADLVKELGLLDKELYFYSVIKKKIEISDLKPWSATFVTALNNAMVFEDMNALGYKLNNKFKRFDEAHTLEAIRTLARFHASSIIYEERKSSELGRCYSLNEEYAEYLSKAGYVDSDKWFIHCMNAAFDAIKQFSKYTKEELQTIESKWFNIWSKALALANASTEYRNVICHRDLWNNNLMFHYDVNNMEPDHCVLVDFQAARYQPPAGDVMLLLYCNLEPKFREEHMGNFLEFYYEELMKILGDYGIKDVINKKKFLESAEIQRQWAVVVCSCLMPQFWIDDDLTTRIFCDTEQFDDILTKNKSAFVIKMMQSDPGYKDNVLAMFEEIVERYCFND